MEPLLHSRPNGGAGASTPVAAVAGRGGGPAGVGHGELVPGIVFVGASDAWGRVTGLVDALVAELSDLSLEGAGRGMLRSLVTALGRVRAGADAAEARTVTALAALDDGGVDPVEVLRRTTGSSQREAQRRRRQTEALAEMPNVAGALASGDISSEHAEALARAAAATSADAVNGDAELLAQVAGVPTDRAGRHIQAWTQRNQDPDDLHEQHLRQRRRRRLNFGDGEPLWHGRGERTATDAQRRALLARDMARRRWSVRATPSWPKGDDAESNLAWTRSFTGSRRRT